MSDPDLRRAKRAKAALVRWLGREGGFVGAGIGKGASGTYEIVVLVQAPDSPVLRKVPESWSGFAVRTEVVGVPRKL